MKTLILGVGNTLFCDDGIGIYIARALSPLVKSHENITVEEASLGGISLMDLLVGYNKAIIIDAVQMGKQEPGHIYRLHADSLTSTRHSDSPHDTDFITALEIGKTLNLALPQEIVIYAVEIENATSFIEECTTKVKEAIPNCVDMILQELNINMPH